MDFIKKENYRESELDRRIFLAGPEGEAPEPETAEAETKPEETAEGQTLEAAAKDPDKGHEKMERDSAETQKKGDEAEKESVEDPEEILEANLRESADAFNETEQAQGMGKIEIGDPPDFAKIEEQIAALKKQITLDGPAKDLLAEVETHFQALRDVEEGVKAPEGEEKPEGGAPEAEEGPAKSSEEMQRAISALYQNRELRFAVLQFLPGEEGKVSQEDFAKLVQGNEDMQKILEGVQFDEKGEPKLDQKGRQALSRVAARQLGVEGMKPAAKREVTEILKVDVNGKTFEEVYGVEAAQMIAIRYSFRRNPEEPHELQANMGSADKPDWKRVDGKKLHTLLPDDIEKAHLETDAEGNVKVKDKEKFTEDLKKAIQTAESSMELRDTLSGTDLDKEGGRTLMELFSSAMQLVSMLKTAMKTGDFQTLQDALSDFKAGKDIATSMENAKSSYDTVINGGEGEPGISDLGTLIAIHAKPYGPEAQNAFTTPDGQLPYRVQAGEVVQGKLEGMLGTGFRIGSLETGAGEAKIYASKAGKEYEINLSTEGEDKISVYEIRGSGEKAQTVPLRENMPIEGSLEASLAIALASPAPAAPATPSEGGAEAANPFEGLEGGLAVSEASEEAKTAARGLYEEAFKAFQNKDFRAALDGFVKAYNTVKSPITRWRVATCLEGLGETEEAVKEARATLEELRASSPDPKSEKAYAKAEKEMSDLIAKHEKPA